MSLESLVCFLTESLDSRIETAGWKVPTVVTSFRFPKYCVEEMLLELAALQAAESAPPAPNTGSPKLLDEMEQFAVMCDRAGNGKDARCVRSWVKQLRASA